MNSIITGVKVVFAIPKNQKPIVIRLNDLVDDFKIRLRFRNTETGKAYIKTKDSIRCFIIKDTPTHWLIDGQLEQGKNKKL
jgi:hypothetical protein